MVIKASPALVAAMLVIAAPAFAQDTVVPPPAAGQAADSTAETGDAAAGVQGGEGTQSGAAPAQADDAAETPVPGDAAAGVEGGEGTQSGAAPATGADTPDVTAGEGTAGVPGGEGTQSGAAPAEATDTEAEAEETPADAAEDTTAETADPADPQLGAYYVKSTQTDWVVRCINTDQPVDPCEMYQLLRDESGNSVAEVTMIPLQGGEVAAGATMVAPLETDLIAGLTLRVDQGQARTYPFNLCTTIGCVARVGFTPAELNQLRRGANATVNLVPFGGDPRDPVSLTMSLAGFTAAINELSENAAAAAEQNTAEEAPAAN